MKAAPLWALLFTLTACGAKTSAVPDAPASTPPPAPPPPAAPALPTTVEGLMAEGEFLAARRRAFGEGNHRIVRLIETRAGVRGRPAEVVILERIAVYEVVSHLSTGEGLFREGQRAAAARHLERGLREIETYSLQRRFPSALRNRVQGLLDEARR